MRKGPATIWALCAGIAAGATPAAATPPPAVVVIGSKKFTESVILGEIAGQIALAVALRAEHRREIGGTRILFNALVGGQIDVYPEYTGTISEEILARQKLSGIDEIRAALAERSIRMTEPLGFNNTYAIGVRPETAERLGIRTISGLRRHTELRLGFTNEFMSRGDGWPALRQRYALPQQDVRGLDHDLALRALQDGSIDATDLYSTDAEIAFYGFRVLDDDLAYFPRYDAVFLYRAELEERVPEFVKALRNLGDGLTEASMIDMNRRVKIDGEPEGAVAADFARRTLGMRGAAFVGETLAVPWPWRSSCRSRSASPRPVTRAAARSSWPRPASFRPCRRLRCWFYSCPSPGRAKSAGPTCWVSGRRRRSRRSFCTACCPSCATPRRRFGASIFPSGSPPKRSGFPRGRSSSGSSCRWARARSWPASRRRS
jgi:glycine betaine/choline ABC-type transport system substrate-binding protein